MGLLFSDFMAVPDVNACGQKVERSADILSLQVVNLGCRRGLVAFHSDTRHRRRAFLLHDKNVVDEESFAAIESQFVGSMGRERNRVGGEMVAADVLGGMDGLGVEPDVERVAVLFPDGQLDGEHIVAVKRDGGRYEMARDGGGSQFHTAFSGSAMVVCPTGVVGVNLAAGYPSTEFSVVAACAVTVFERLIEECVILFEGLDLVGADAE